MKRLKVILGSIFILMASISVLSFQGCNKEGSKVSSETIKDSVTTTTTTLTETDADLLSTDYKDFYDALAAKGEWIKVMPEDLGIKVKTTSKTNQNTTSESDPKTSSETDQQNVQETASGAFFVWKPAPGLNLGVAATPNSPPTLTTTVTTPVSPASYVPYTNGSWVNTDNGWYFQSATPEEEIVHHYGRWDYSDNLGWVWIPGKVWSPAWVDWKEKDNTIAWAPLPYSSTIVDNRMPAVQIPADRYVMLEKPHFLDPVYTYRLLDPVPVVKIESFSPLPGLTVVNNAIVNKGPDVVVIEKATGKKVIVYPINRVASFGDVRVKENTIYTYAPAFHKVLDKESPRPSKVYTFLEAREKYGNKYGDMTKMEKKNEENNNKEGNKEWKNEQKDNKDKKEKPYKHDDNDWNKDKEKHDKNKKHDKKDDVNHTDPKKVEKPNVPVEKEHKEKKDKDHDKEDHGKKEKKDK
ncbi:hypothetical protein BH10BAC5_BH10BAC5_22460 [soil metagenome]